MALAFFILLVPSAPAAVSSPPRGWNSYDAYTWHVNETQFLSNCKVLSKRLLPFGYDTCVVDYLWYQSDGSGEWSLDDECRPVPNAQRWPSTNGLGFKPIADKVHAMGLKFGIHIMLGTSTYAVEKNCVIAGTSSTIRDIAGPQCGWKGDSLQVNVSHPAGKQFYDSLYAQYAAWGVDFIKNDCIFGGESSRRASQPCSAPWRTVLASLTPLSPSLLLFAPPSRRQLCGRQHPRAIREHWESWSRDGLQPLSWWASARDSKDRERWQRDQSRREYVPNHRR